MSASLAIRSVEPEWLDLLPSEDSRARRSRRDLVLVNALMRNAGGLARALRDVQPRRLAELGAGTGEVLASVAGALRAPARVDAVLVDLHPCTDDAAIRRLERAGWCVQRVQADVFAWLHDQPDDGFDAIVANLFLHHFEDAALRRMLQLAARKARAFVACEPLRTEFALGAAALLPFLGCNGVTRHDAVVSVRAGFRDAELTALWPREGWRRDESRWGLFTHRFVARRA